MGSKFKIALIQKYLGLFKGLKTLGTNQRQCFMSTKDTISEAPKALCMVMADQSKKTKGLISNFLAENFVKEEPVIQAAQLEDTRDLQGYIDRDVEHGKTLLIVNPDTDEIVAAAVNTVTRPCSINVSRDYADIQVKSPRTKRLLYFWAHMLEDAKLFDKFPVDQMWNITYLATNKKMRGLGLARFLANQSRQMAIDRGFSVVHIECTNHYTGIIAKRLGFRGCEERKVQSYVDKEGKPWIPGELPKPHGSVTVAVEKL